MQRALIIIGLMMVLAGLAWPWLSRLPLGRLPGDIVIERDNLRLYFPLVTMIVVSVVLSLIMWFFRK
jgi:hypothetical protein